MQYRELNGSDLELIDAAFEAIRRNHWPDHHHVGATVRAGSGKIYVGVHLESPGVDVCAEWSAVGSATAAGERELLCIVAANCRLLMPPCGVCRELLHYFSPHMDVIVPTADGPKKVWISDLLPIPYAQPRPHVGTVRERPAAE